MKILVFENEFDAIENAFKYLNLKEYSNSLIVDDHPRSQSIGDINNINDYDIVFIDLDLSTRSNLDGFGLIRKIESELSTYPELVILTGQDVPEDYVSANSLKKKYRILEKPINFSKLKNIITEINKS
jgi:DNA-binding response OmpR family regulator